MNPAKFALLLGVGLLAFLFVSVLYVVWTRIVGLDPTVAQRFDDLPNPVGGALAAVSGVVLGSVSIAAPTVEFGVAAMVLLAASTFASLLLFELFQQRSRIGA
ncbi:hypothetical protein NGM10_02405 [Halorussus salilacus]|uniref:hypothetical protein n=1 Tax=Halorussus salilacus TaxID=2953750 RepID=UPI00209F15F0|nr:hypothetical protein [Halorussus salilacus]USZ68604.1 hypothetical protein NGM10_02405 [Halorussus salilacus]